MHHYTIIAFCLIGLAVALLFFMDSLISPNTEQDALKMVREHHMLIAGAALFGAYYMHTLVETSSVVSQETGSSSMDLPSYDEATSQNTSDILNL